MTFDDIFYTHQKMVFNLALRYVQNVEDAEEIAQDVFVKVYDNLKIFKNESTIKTWIYRITINRSLDFIRAKNTQKRKFYTTVFSLNDPTHRIEVSNFNHPGIDLENKEAIKFIFQGINQLNDNQKTAIILIAMENKSYAEASEILEISVKAFESLYHRAKKNLELILTPQKQNGKQ